MSQLRTFLRGKSAAVREGDLAHGLAGAQPARDAAPVPESPKVSAVVGSVTLEFMLLLRGNEVSAYVVVVVGEDSAD